MTEKTVDIIAAVLKELDRADEKHGPMLEPIEGLKTLQCEVCELDREVMRKNFDLDAMRTEAIHCAAMGLKFLRDCCPIGEENG